MYLGKWIRHSGWSSFYKLKLFRRSKGNYTEDVMHETVKLEGKFGRLSSPLNITPTRPGHGRTQDGSQHHDAPRCSGRGQAAR